MIALRGIVRQKEDDKKWVWNGIWTFGSLPDDEQAALAARNPSVRPFSYAWDQPRLASDVLVPSANVHHEEKTETTEPSNKEDTADASSSKEALLSKDVEMADAKAPENTAATAASGEKNFGSTTSTVKGQDTKPMQVDDSKKAEEKQNAGGDESEMSKANSTPSNTQEGTAKKTIASADSSKKDEQEKPEAKNESEVKPPKPPAITFATTRPDEPPFTEAATKHPDKCPPGGTWKGYFETATNRKDQSTMRIPEDFSLFFNATPPKDARVLFPVSDDDKEKPKDETASLLPAGHVHVRGCGLNQYGTWELIGSLNTDTGVLECQRMYVQTQEKKSHGRRGRPRKSEMKKKVSIVGSASDLDTKTPGAGGRSTRKRQLSWRKRASLHGDDELDVQVSRKGTGKRGRPRKNPPPEAIPGMTFIPTPGSIVSIPSTGSSKRSPLPSPRLPAKSAKMGPKKRAKASPPATSSSAVKLPRAGDPNEARWRAAHFLYYQRYVPSSDGDGTGGGASGAGSSEAANFVVYEGDMSEGYCLRDGRGVCLFNNGTLYEGDWKRNKEHGKGTLMTADRKHTIYTGEWERGRMHGMGTYYYTQDDPYAAAARIKDDSGEQLGSRYEGQFRENARHGNGKYFLPNGSVYDGEWREDVMSGHGSFRWPDGSIYVGQWKDGKRNGSGVLQAADGFTYDGSWADNAMDGRGIATYPGGQRYEGLFSNGRREGRGSIHFANGAVYEGRFRDDCMEGQGTMKMTSNAPIPRRTSEEDEENDENEEDWMIPISFQSDMGHIHQKAGFTVEGE